MEHHKEVGLNNYAMKNSSLEEVIEIIGRFVIGAKPCSPREIVDACASAYTMLKEQPPLPSNLDEAEEKYSENIGVSHTLSEWSEITGMNCFTIQSRKRRGWSDEDALSIPERKARDYDDRVGKEELTVILNNSIISGICVNKIDFIRKTGITKSSFFYTLKGDRRMSKETSKKVRRFNEHCNGKSD